MKEKIIFHIDVNNAFLSWSAILLLNNGHNKDIRKIPSIIGGNQKKRHGIVLAKSPIAKKYGIKTAETIYQAMKKCPQLEIYPPNHQWYSIKSNELFNYLSQYTPIIEKYSIDECFLDMTGTSYLYKDYIELAHKIKKDILEKFGYTVNVGIGNNKLCAKMASDFEKPNKVHTLFKDEIEEKIWPLEVSELFMCGKKTTEVLNKLNIYTIKDLAHANDNVLERNFKNQSVYLKKAAWGIDESKVESKDNKRESISTTETLPYNYNNPQKLKEILLRQTEKVSRELREQKQYAKTVAVIYKNSDFVNYSAQIQMTTPTNKTNEIYLKVVELFNNSWKKDPLRLIGVKLTGFTDTKEYQTTIFDSSIEANEKDDEIQSIVDTINNKYGNNAITTASLKKITK